MKRLSVAETKSRLGLINSNSRQLWKSQNNHSISAAFAAMTQYRDMNEMKVSKEKAQIISKSAFYTHHQIQEVTVRMRVVRQPKNTMEGFTQVGLKERYFLYPTIVIQEPVSLLSGYQPMCTILIRTIRTFFIRTIGNKLINSASKFTNPLLSSHQCS